MEKKFRKGDRVRYIGDGEDWVEFAICYGEEFEIEDVTDFDDGDSVIKVKSSYVEHLGADDLELVSRPSEDPKTAFLTELKELLIKYNVEIDAYGGDDGDHGVGFKIGDDIIWYSHDWCEQTEFTFPITPSNIFDYDK